MQDADGGPSLFPAGTNQAVDREMDHHSPDLSTWSYIKSSLKASFQTHLRTLVSSSSAFEFAKHPGGLTKRPRSFSIPATCACSCSHIKQERFAKMFATMTSTDSLDNITHRATATATATPFNFSLFLSFLSFYFSFSKWPV